MQEVKTMKFRVWTERPGKLVHISSEKLMSGDIAVRVVYANGTDAFLRFANKIDWQQMFPLIPAERA